ncbi:MAG: hypothetical protein LAO22_09190 [Acidobacteriia bacterium]|nr:hypothetical protein [Terriglobia bacterium]
MGFEQATIRIEKEREFGDLKAALAQTFSSDRIVKYLKALDRRNIRIRNLDAVLRADVTDSATGAKAGTARSLYEALTVSDQAQMREFYLSKIEEVEPALRANFSKLYQYY